MYNRSRPVAAATAFTLLVAGLLTGTAPIPASAADGAVSGVVFRDFDADGMRDTGNGPNSGVQNDSGLGDVTVTAYDDAGDSWSTVSAADGTYSIAVVGSSAATVRVEFTGLPAGYEPAPVHAAPADNGTAVQFVSVGTSGVDFGVNAPEDYSQPAAPLVTAIQWSGSPFAVDGGTKMDEPALAGIGYGDGINPGPQVGFPGRVTLATFGEVGAVSSNVYQASSNSVFTSAIYKRQSGLGPLGLGGIYRVTDALDGANNPSGAGAVIPWLDVATIGINVGTAQTNPARGLTGAASPTNDPDAFAQAGKIGIGDMVLSPDGNTLYFINLFDKRLYAIDVSNPVVPPATFLSYDLGLGIGERPSALTVYRGELYVGFVDSGETDLGPQPGLSADVAGLEAHVIKAPVSALGGVWTEVLTADLGYTKGGAYFALLAPQGLQWNTWTDTWTWPGGAVSELALHRHIYPQAILSDLYLDEDGFLSLGFTDRTSIQGGNRNYAADPLVPGTYETVASGDILIASPNIDGTFTLENDGVVGTGPSQRTTTSTVPNQAPGGRDFYADEAFLGDANGHQEATLGYLAGMRGTREIVTTAYDPLTNFNAAGFLWAGVDTGGTTAAYEITPAGSNDPSAGNFQKGGGLGGISLLALAAPVEVGNRVWFDADKDGIQDASEPAVAGVTVNLIRNGVIVATTVTSPTGEYYFSSDSTSPFYDADLVPGGGEYTIDFVPPTTGNLFTNDATYGTVPWNRVALTFPATGSDENDSNPDRTTGEYTFNVGGPGENDHTIDAGLIIDLAVDIEKGDGADEEIVHDADTSPEAQNYGPGETREIVYLATNTGVQALREVVLTERTLAGTEILDLVWTMPDGSTVEAVEIAGVWTARWEATFDPGTTTWEAGDVITGTATLRMAPGTVPHVDRARVDAIGAVTGVPVNDFDDYHATASAALPGLANTGVDMTTALLLALGVFTAGGALLLVTRLRRARR